ncbi:MAG: phage tail protein [Clostridia bacterium]|nr:phage tail protein [Clostridia bacterium]
MYTILADGDLLYSPLLANTDKSYAAINPRLLLEVNKAGNLSFMILPGNRKYADIKKLKTIITVEQDEKEIFRGRVTDITTDIFLQKTVYVEGELAFLIDSIQRPYEYEGAANALFSMLIENHNAQVDEEKRFAVGNITAVSAEEVTHVKVGDYSDTFSEISYRLLDVYGGYLKIRVEGETRYIDYVSEYGTDSAQSVSFGVNMVSLDAGGNSADIFTVLIPLGAAVKGEDGEMKPLDIASVNDGKDYIEDPEGILKYGRIVRTYTWSHIDDAEKLIEKAREYLSFGITEKSTLTIRAVDMHLLDGSIDAIRLGGYVNIQAAPHGITRPEICARIDYDLINPENTVYTFGLPKKSLTDNVVQVIKKMGGGGGGGMGTGMEEEILWLERWAEIFQDENIAKIELITGQIDHFTGRISNAEILLDGVEAEVEILADEYTVLDGRISGCESSIKVNADNIELKVNKNGVISSINQSAEQVKISASKVVLSGYVTASEFNATIASLWDAEITYIDAATVDAGTVNTSFLTASSFTLANHAVKIQTLSMGSIASRSVLTTEIGGIDLSHSHAVSVADDGTVTLGEVSEKGGNFKIADTKAYKAGVAAAYNEGWAAAAAVFNMAWDSNVLTITHAGEAPESENAADTVKVTVGYTLNNITNTAPNTFYVSGWAYANTSDNGGSSVRRSSANMTKTQTINVGQ